MMLEFNYAKAYFSNSEAVQGDTKTQNTLYT